jgi:hypothetical protein
MIRVRFFDRPCKPGHDMVYCGDSAVVGDFVTLLIGGDSTDIAEIIHGDGPVRFATLAFDVPGRGGVEPCAHMAPGSRRVPVHSVYQFMTIENMTEKEEVY